MSIKNNLDKIKYDNNDKYLCIGIGETSKNLQVINGILIKLESEIGKYMH